jgi:hypothetical protein
LSVLKYVEHSVVAALSEHIRRQKGWNRERKDDYEKHILRLWLLENQLAGDLTDFDHHFIVILCAVIN